MADNWNEVTFEIVERIGVIAKNTSGWTKEINLVSWNGGQAKYDIRDWDPDHEHMSRGITLSEKDMSKVREMLNERDNRTASHDKEKIVVGRDKRKWLLLITLRYNQVSQEWLYGFANNIIVQNIIISVPTCVFRTISESNKDNTVSRDGES